MVKATKGLALLEAFIRSTGISEAELARQAGIHAVSLNYLTRRARVANLRIAFALEDATKGEVEARAWLEPI